ncbi:MAG: hypothetical protein IJV71_05775 [Lachnospiraceae bacterium]|nr:hypothetical protein [Lachnospiraceae bacterium]
MRQQQKGKGYKGNKMRQENIKAVCSNNEARQYFTDKGLTYSDITEGDILTLTMLLNKHIKAAVKASETSVDTLRLSNRVDIKTFSDGTIKTCFLYVNSHYFKNRECISFNADGFIGFAGWADQGNTNPILRAFLEWCDYLAGSSTGGTE